MAVLLQNKVRERGIGMRPRSYVGSSVAHRRALCECFAIAFYAFSNQSLHSPYAVC